MAKIKSFKKGVEKVKDHAFEINEFALETADEAVDIAIENSLRWQKLFGKAIKGGSKLFWKQQDLALSALENVGDQVIDNSQKLADFLEVDNVLAFFQPISKAKKAASEAKAKKAAIVKKAYPVTKPASKVAKKVTKTIKLAKVEATAEAKKAEKTAKKAVKKAAKKARKAAVNPPTKAAKTTKKVAKVTPIKATKTTKKVVTPKTAVPTAKVKRKVVRTIRKDNLRVIEGIGAKTEILLNEAGIYSYKELAKASKKRLQAVLETAGPRFAKFDASIWTKQAALAVEGKLTK